VTTPLPQVPEAGNYPQAFRSMIARSVTLAMEEAAQPGWRPEPSNRDRLLFSLANALRLPAAWPTALPLLATLAPRMEQAGLREEWLEYVERGIECCDSSGDLQTAAHLALERGILLERLGRLPQAQGSLEQAVERYTTCGNRRGAAKAHNRLAYVLRGRNAAIEAAEHVERAQTLLDFDDSELLYCDLMWGVLARDRHDWVAAEMHLQRCVDGLRATQDQRMYGMSLINLGGVYVASQEYAKAVEHFNRAVGVLAEIGDRANEALVHLNLGGIYLCLHQPECALDESLTAEAVYRELQDEQRLALVYSNLALAYGQLRRVPEAERSFEAAIERFQSLGDYNNLVDTMIDLGRLYLQHNRRQEARQCTMQAYDLLENLPYAIVRAYQRTKIEDLLSNIDKSASGEDRSGQP
jgi:tetratricopeptide (TPR) repeat protein